MDQLTLFTIILAFQTEVYNTAKLFAYLCYIYWPGQLD